MTDFEVKARTVAYIKITGEPVFVLATGNGSASVRRPKQTSEGVEYIEAQFFLDELETPDAKVLREFEELNKQRELIMKNTKGIKDVPEMVN